MVDEHSRVRSAVTRALRATGEYTVVGEVTDGAAAIEIVERTMPDVVVMARNMPVMDGLEATLAIKTQHPTIAVISFSNEPESASADAFGQVAPEPNVKDLIEQIRRLVAH